MGNIKCLKLDSLKKAWIWWNIFKKYIVGSWVFPKIVYVVGFLIFMNK